MKEKQEIAKMISDGRKKKNLTQQDLANLLNVSDKAVSNWETGKNYPDYAYLNDLSKILDINFTSTETERKQSNKKIIFQIFGIILILIILANGLYFINNYNKINIYSINTTDKNINLKDSYLIVSNNKVILNLNQLNNRLFITQPQYNITIYSKNNDKKEVNLNENSYDGISIIENKKSLEINKKILDNLENIYIKIEYKNSENKIQTKELKLTIKKEISNNKLFYLNEKNSKKEMSINTINLLKNNNYIKKSKDIYEKSQKDEKYIYDYQSGILDYTSVKNNVTIKARGIYENSKNAIHELIYEVYENNKLIEYYPNNSDNMEGIIYYWDIYRIIDTEHEKITP